MNQSHLLVVLFVATMVCNGNCRPREVDIKNIYPVYRSVKQLEPQTPNRYEKPFKDERDDDSVTYMRIDIPYKNVNDLKRAEGLAAKNNSKSIVDYVPVALTIKKSNVKKWPSDQNGIESPDDLSLYNIYTNNINPLIIQHTTKPGPALEIPLSKPSILILEELTTRKPFPGPPGPPGSPGQSVFSQPIQILSRPPPLSYPVHVEIPPQSFPVPPAYNEPSYLSTVRPLSSPGQNLHPAGPIYDPPPPSPIYTGGNQYFPAPSPPQVDYFSTTTNPISPTYVQPPEVVTTQVEIITHSTTPQPETTTKKNTKCPNVSIMATTSINNNNSLNKEGCQDIDIQINTILNNSNVVRPAKPPNNSGVVVQSDEGSQTGVFGVFDVLWSILSRFFNFSFSTVLSPFSSFFTALFFPWIFPHLFFGKKRTKKKFVVLGEPGGKPTEYVYRSLNNNSHYLRRTTRDLGKWHSPYHGWGIEKKISSTVNPATEENVAEEQNAKEVKDSKINIESIATVARASSDGPSLPSPSSLGQMIDTVSQMVESDIRTPPKLKEIIKEKTNEHRKEALGENSTPLPYTFIYDDEMGKGHYEMTDHAVHIASSEGKASNMNVKIATDEGVKGIAIPVVMDDMDFEPTSPPKKLQKIPEVPKPGKEDKKKNAITKPHPTTTPSSGLSTWILLSDNKDVTTPSPKKNNNKKEGNEDKKKGNGSASTTKKPIKIQATTLKSTTSQANKKVTQKTTNSPNKKTDTDSNAMSALEAMVKNQKKTTATTSKPKTTENIKTTKKPTDPKKKLPDRLEVAESKDKVAIELPEYKTTYTLPPNLQITTEDKSVAVTTSQTSTQTTTENSVEGTTKKKSSTKKKKKNKNRRKKPTTDDTGVEAKIPQQAMGSQIYNFLSREIVPTVGLGLIGVALTAGLASFLGYNPFVSSTVPLRRTYDTHHGYSPNNYYNYNTDYGDGGQSEEVLLREVLSGMPEDSRYGLTHSASNYPEAYNRQDQVYDSMKNPVYPSATASIYNSEKDIGNYDTSYPQDYSSGYGTSYDTPDKKYSTEVKDKYPVYNRETGTSFVYPETTGMTSAEKTSRINTESGNVKGNSDTIERQPEALYRVAGDSDLQYRNGESTIQGVSGQNSWHRIGTPMDSSKPFPHLEPGPRSLDLSKESAKAEPKKRTKRNAESVIQRISRKRTKKENDVENEIDFDDSFSGSKNPEQNFFDSFTTTTAATKTTTTGYPETTVSTEMDFLTTMKPKEVSSTTEELKEASRPEPTNSYESTENESTAPTTTSGVSVLDVLKRLAQFKLRLGLNFLRSTTDMFSRYLDDIQRRVDESFVNTTTTTVQYNRRKNPWSGFFFSRDDDAPYRRKRSVLDDNQFLSAMLTEEDKINDRFSKTTKKDLKPSDKIFHQKKNLPKKYESRRTN